MALRDPDDRAASPAPREPIHRPARILRRPEWDRLDSILPAARPRPGVWRQLCASPLAVASIAVLAFLAVGGLAADVLSAWLFGVGPTTQNLRAAYARPDLWQPSLWLGADELGRSQVVRLLYAARISLAVGLGAAALNLTLGVLVGLAAGYFRGRLDDALQWLASTIRSAPSLFLLLTIAVLFEPGPWVLVAVLGLISWPSAALFVRGQTLSLRTREYVGAARTLGASDWRLMRRHLLPNLLPLVVTLAAIDVGSMILAESSLSFLGLGIMPPTPSWGNMLTNAVSALGRAPWLVWGPGALIFLTVLALYLLGDALRDALDPRLSPRSQRPR
ncbi:MAG: ABC transporter permease [Chloroflexi bacterium]|nr:ABC transporter permease [Chloroflexota bacterium]